MREPKTFRIGVPTFKRPDDLHKLLKALEPQLLYRDNFKLVVVNDASHSDEYQAVVDDVSFPLEYKIQDKNSGPGPTRHAAFVRASEDYLVCTDDDCIPPLDWLKWIEASVCSEPNVDLFVGTTSPVFLDKPSILSKLLTVPSIFPSPVVNERGLITAIGANAIIKRTAYEKAGGYSPQLNGAVEDCWLTQALLNSGATYKFLGKPVIGHKAISSIRELWNRFHWYGIGGAQMAILEQEYKVAELGAGETMQERRNKIFRKVKAEWQRHKNDQLLKRLGNTGSVFLAALAYAKGWKDGVKKYSAEYDKDIPTSPEIHARFMDFTQGSKKHF